MQLSIIFVLLGWVAVVHSSDPSQPSISSKNPESNENYLPPSSKNIERNLKQCKPIEPNELPRSTTTPVPATTRRLVPLPTLAPSSIFRSTELNSVQFIDNTPDQNVRKIVPLPTLKPTSTDSESTIVPSNGRRRLVPLPTLAPRRKLVPLPTLKPTSTSSTTEVSLENSDQIPDDYGFGPPGSYVHYNL